MFIWVCWQRIHTYLPIPSAAIIKMKPIATGHLLLMFSNIQLTVSKPNVGTMNMQTINHMSSMVTPNDLYEISNTTDKH